MKKKPTSILNFMILKAFIITTILSVFFTSSTFAGSKKDWGPYTPQKPLTLKLAYWVPQQMPAPFYNDPFALMFERWADTIEEETGNRVKFQRYPSESLVKMADYMDALRVNLIDVGLVFPPAFPGEFQSPLLLALPGLFPNSTIAGIVVQKLHDEGYTTDDWKDVHVLWHASNNSQDIVTVSRPINSLKDFKGMKIAAQGEPEVSAIKALGAIPVGIPIYEQYIALERGTVDGAWLEFNGQVSFKFYEAGKYFRAGYGTARTLDYAMSKITYNKLPPAIKEVVDNNSGLLWTIMTGKHFDDNVALSIGFIEDYCKKNGYPPISYATPGEIAQMKKMWAPVHKKVIADLEAKGYPAKKMYKRIGELVERFKGYRLGGLEDYRIRSLKTAN